MEIVRFGVGHRRPEGPTGTRHVTGQVIFSDDRGLISELAFGRNAAVESHSNPRSTWFVVIEGGGFVQVGEEQTRIAAGEAVLWPPGVPHAAWTDYSQMRAIVVEFSAEDPRTRMIIEGRAQALLPGQFSRRAEGHLVDSGRHPGYDPREGEPV